MPTYRFAAPFVHAVGGDLQAQIEQHRDPAQIGYPWDYDGHRKRTGPVFVAMNKLSMRNRDARFLFKLCGQP